MAWSKPGANVSRQVRAHEKKKKLLHHTHSTHTHAQPSTTATLLNKSATLATLPAVNAIVTKLLPNSPDTTAAVDQLLGLPVAKGGVTPTATAKPLGLAMLGGKCGAGVAACLHGCCAEVREGGREKCVHV